MVAIDGNYSNCRCIVNWLGKWKILCSLLKNFFLYIQFWLCIRFKIYYLNYFKIDIENKPQLALHHLSLDFHPFLHSHSCCSSQPITRIFPRSVEAGLGLPLFACSCLHLDWTPAIAPGNRRISTLNLLDDFISIPFMSKIPSLSISQLKMNISRILWIF